MMPSPLLSRTFPIRSSACWEPVVMITFSVPRCRPKIRLYRSAMYCLSSGRPAVTEYWNTLLLYVFTMRSIETSSSSCGKETGFGSPPAKEITSGSEAAFKIPLTNDGGVALIPSDNKFSIPITMHLSLQIFFIIFRGAVENNNQIA